MKTKLAFGSIALLVLFALSASHFTAAEEKEGKAAVETTLHGTVVDLHCYVSHGIRDAAHTACSNSCIARGLPVGFLADDGTLYLLLGEKPVSIKDRVAGLADVPVEVRGTISVRDGVKGIQMRTIEKIAVASKQ
jgi:hypothetical protein